MLFTPLPILVPHTLVHCMYICIINRGIIAGFTKLGAGTFSITIIIIIIIIFISTHRLVRRIAPQGHDGSVQKL